MFDLELAYLRSRVKRIVNFANKADAQAKASKKELSVFLQENAKELKEEFQQAIKNRLEAEFGPSEWNTFRLAMNEGESDMVKRYGGVLPEECLKKGEDVPAPKVATFE
eukprot:CAMPEP_0114603196 /NCGR_PEP_ID=MMETSP0125-20121206/25635_1 /TAXON_ID=485358 ORGANISM="Aristerostoma sp., Strain ATCC 50986" /NCGR_SAMPLE_ID=MMETSP0125 /ASSEMBLY_ACC=CAM_ASM_000245 /LENGTH=108 /DNA_ID=CAMNT_0001813823 /DNA_START=386 /DNA_END=709 /DNA_ORIENTATION=+